MRVLVDTSAYYALASTADETHDSARRLLAGLAAVHAELWAVSYVVTETVALIQSRLGLEQVRRFRVMLEESANILWVDDRLHQEAWDELERVGRRHVSLVDCCSGLAARQMGIQHVFAFDPHFDIWGIEPVTLDTLTSAESDT